MDEYIIYEKLGDEHIGGNINQAYLCYENAEFLCKDENIRAGLTEKKNKLLCNNSLSVRKTSIIIVSYNCMYMMQKCIEAIRSSCPEKACEIVVVDNASSDGIREWLCEQEDIKVILLDENVGFPVGCNIGAQYSEPENDILLLNNDTRLAHNSLFWLRMGLYENERIGASGGISNYAGNRQQVDIEYPLPAEYLEYGRAVNVPMQCPYEERVRLSGFAMLVKRDAWNMCGGMDESFSPGYFEDDDLSMRLVLNGYRLILCRNSFIYHAGSQSFANKDGVNELLEQHRRLFENKFGFDIIDYAYKDMETAEQIPFGKDDEINILHLGSGLGAALKLIRTRFCNAHAVGVEKNECLRMISGCTEMVFDSVDSLTQTLNGKIFHVLIIGKDTYKELDREKLAKIKKLCRDDCVLLPEPKAQENIDFDKIKLVIWDLDDTLWNGTLSEGAVNAPVQNAELIKSLTDCGIVNTISSKNDEQNARQALEQLGIWDFFVFNNINWDNKGEQIKKKLENMNLRAENALFIDDNPRNLEEAKHFNEGIMTSEPCIIARLIEYIGGQVKKDVEHKRLKQYKLLEKKCIAKSNAGSDTQFLYDSDIHIVVKDDCAAVIDRIAELVERTNQLNYTKLRSSREELLEQINDKNNMCGYVSASDRFGDYGIVGFYCYSLMDKRLVHFLFSCRVMGMGIEQMVYVLLGVPDIMPVLPVAVMLDKDGDAPWVNVDIETGGADAGKSVDEEHTQKARILLKGPCDLSAIEGYLSGAELTKEFNYVNDKGFITTGQNHSMHIWESAYLAKEEIGNITENVPFITSGDFETSIFDKEYNIVCYSLLPDCHAGLYKNKESEAYISFGSCNFDLTDKNNTGGYIDGSIVNHAFPFTEEIINRFSEEWQYMGTTAPQDLLRNLDYMLEHAAGHPDFIFILGSEIEYEGENEEFRDHAERHKEINRVVREHVRDNDRVKLVEITKFIHSQDDYLDCINHFKRNVYYDMATEICSCINEFIKSHKE